MRKIIKWILAIIEVATLAAVLLCAFVPSVKETLEPAYKYILLALALVTVLWIIIFCFSAFRKESGITFEKKMSFHDDVERNPLNIDERDTQDIYTNFERAEFSTKIREPYQKEEISYTDHLYDVKPAEEVKPVEEVLAEPVVEEVKPVEEPKVEETPVAEETPIEVPVAPTPKALRALKEVTIWEGFNTEISENWVKLLEKELKGNKDNISKIKEIYESGKQVYPTKENLFKPFKLTDHNDVKVVIIGKIPYYRKNQADGLAFSTDAAQAPNQSTTVIINEAVNDVGIAQPENGSLEAWAKQGVLLINSVMSAPSDKPASHTDLWKPFTDDIINELIKDKAPKAFVLWGEHAQAFKEEIEKQSQHLIIEAPSPSPLSAANGFYNSKPFSRINKFLEEKGIEPINWELK